MIGLGLLERHLEMAVLLQLAPGRLPPFLPVVADDVRHEDLLDLVHGGLAAVAVQHQLDQFQVVRGGHLAQALQVGGFAGEDVVLGDGLERFGGERQVHGVAGLVVEIDREAGEDRVHRLDSSEAPAPVHAEAGVGQLHQSLDVVPLQLARRRHLLEFFSHKVS